MFTNFSFRNNGLAIDTTLNDLGREKITNNSADKYLFKVPSIRNLSFTYPYMHDGRFKKIRDVLNHYTTSLVKGETLSIELNNAIQLTADEKRN